MSVHALLPVLLLLAVLASLPAEAVPTKTVVKAKGVYLNTPEPHTPIEHNNRGVELGSKGIWPDAIREHEIAFEMDKHNKLWQTNLSAAHLEYGKYLAARGQGDKAQAQFRLALLVDSANGTADRELDKTFASKKIDPADYEFRKSLAESADKKGDYRSAIVEWRKCIALRDIPLDHANLGRALLLSGKEIEGFNQLKEAVGRSGWPEDQKIELATCHRDLAELLRKLANNAMKNGNREIGTQRLANSAVEFRRAAFLNPADGRAVQGLIDVSLQVVSINPSFNNHLTLSAAYMIGGDFPHAKQELSFCRKLSPRNPELKTAYMSLFYAIVNSPLKQKTEFLAETLDDMKQMLSQDPENSKLQELIAKMQEKVAELSKPSAEPALP